MKKSICSTHFFLPLSQSRFSYSIGSSVLMSHERANCRFLLEISSRICRIRRTSCHSHSGIPKRHKHAAILLALQSKEHACSLHAIYSDLSAYKLLPQSPRNVLAYCDPQTYISVHTVTWRLKAGIVEQMFIAEQRLGNHVSVTTYISKH
jgi:hypothetical protein